MKNLAIIPARSGSKRIHDKNICQFAGRPLMAWSIGYALASGLFDRVYVSTDSSEYAQVARQYGAWVPFLRERYADDVSGVMQVAAHELDRIEREFGCRYDNVAMIQATCPFCSDDVMREVYGDFLAKDAVTMTTCFAFSHCNPWWAFRLEDSGAADFLLASPEAARSQDRPPLYCPTGALVFAKAAELKDNPSAYGVGHLFHPVPWWCGFDIDEPSDLALGELLMKVRHADNRS